MKYFKNILKVLLSLLVIISVALLGLYIHYDTELPQGKQGAEADQLAKKMLKALNYESYKKLDYIEWGFSRLGKVHHYQWYKKKGFCRVKVDSVSVDLNTLAPDKSFVKINGKEYHGQKEKEFISLAHALFNNDSFWLVAPYKLFDSGVERRWVKQENGKDALLITYTQGGTTPGDSYLWILDENHRPTAYKMWVKIIPIGGLLASWEDWTAPSRGAYFPQKHKILGLEIDIVDLEVK